jgi:hypothetical protein
MTSTAVVNLVAEWLFILKDTSGNTVAIFDAYKSANVHREKNNMDVCTLTFYNNNDQRFKLFKTDYILIGQRSIPEFLEPYSEFVGFVRTVNKSVSADGKKDIEVVALGLEFLLAGKTIAYDAGTIRAEKDDYAETVMKEYVNENCGDSAYPGDVVGRLAEGRVPGFRIDQDQGLGPNWFGSREYENLLEVLREISEYASMDFEIKYSDPAIFTFFTYANFGFGIDRTDEAVDRLTGVNVYGNAPIVFSEDFGNVADISYSYDRSAEANVVIVLGDGDGSTRKSITVEDPLAIAASPFNRREITRSGSEQEFEYQLKNLGLEELSLNKFAQRFEFTPMKQESYMYGKHFKVGDKVVLIYDDFKVYIIIETADIDITTEGEKVVLGARVLKIIEYFNEVVENAYLPADFLPDPQPWTTPPVPEYEIPIPSSVGLLRNVHSNDYQYTSHFNEITPTSINVPNGVSAVELASPAGVESLNCGFVVGVNHCYFSYFPNGLDLLVKEYSLATGLETGSVTIDLDGTEAYSDWNPMTYIEDRKILIAYSKDDGAGGGDLYLDEIDFSIPSATTVYTYHVDSFIHRALSLTSVDMGTYIKVLLTASSIDVDTFPPLAVTFLMVSYRSDTQVTNLTTYSVDTTYPADNYVNEVWVRRSPVVIQDERVVFFLDVDGGYNSGPGAHEGEGYIIDYDLNDDTYDLIILYGEDPNDWPDLKTMSYDKDTNTVLFSVSDGPNDNTYPYQYFVYNPATLVISDGQASALDHTLIHVNGHAYFTHLQAADTMGIYDYDNASALNGTVGTTWNIGAGYRGVSHVGDQNGDLIWFWVGTNIVGADVADGSIIRTLDLGLSSASFEAGGVLNRDCTIFITSQQIFFICHNGITRLYLYMFDVS